MRSLGFHSNERYTELYQNYESTTQIGLYTLTRTVVWQNIRIAHAYSTTYAMTFSTTDHIQFYMFGNMKIWNVN